MISWSQSAGLRVRLTRDATRIVVEVPGGERLWLGERAARDTLAALQIALAGLTDGAPPAVARLGVARRRVFAPWWQHRRQEAQQHRALQRPALLLAMLVYPLPWALCMAPAVILLARGTVPAAIGAWLVGSAVAAVGAWRWAGRSLGRRRSAPVRGGPLTVVSNQH